MPLTPRDLGWIAGFLEGEASFYLNRGITPGVRVYQVQRAPLDRLMSLVGGRLYERARSNPRWSDFHDWICVGTQGVGLMMTVYREMSPKRQAQIRAILSAWRARRPRHAARTHCPQGHRYDDANTYRWGRNGHRGCRACRTTHHRVRRLAIAMLSA